MIQHTATNPKINLIDGSAATTTPAQPSNADTLRLNVLIIYYNLNVNTGLIPLHISLVRRLLTLMSIAWLSTSLTDAINFVIMKNFKSVYNSY